MPHSPIDARSVLKTRLFFHGSALMLNIPPPKPELVAELPLKVQLVTDGWPLTLAIPPP